MALTAVVILVRDVFTVDLGEKLSLRPLTGLVFVATGAERPVVAGGFWRVAEGGKVEPAAAVVAAVAVECLFAGRHFVE